MSAKEAYDPHDVRLRFMKKIRAHGFQRPRKIKTKTLNPVNRAARRAIAATKGKNNATNR